MFHKKAIPISAALVAVVIFGDACSGLHGEARTQDQGTLKCDTGSIVKTIGGTNWIVSSCADGESMIVISAGDNPATPFVFFLKKENSKYIVYGEGNGDKAASEAAGLELSKMSAKELAMLLAETQAQR